MIHKVISVASLTVAMVSASIAAVSVYMVRNDVPYLTYINLPFPTVTPKVKAGEVISLIVERCNSDSVSHNYVTTHGVRGIDNNYRALLPEVIVYIQPGCTKSESRINKLPPDTPPGKFVVFGMAEIQGLHTHSVDWESQIFEVIQ